MWWALAFVVMWIGIGIVVNLCNFERTIQHLAFNAKSQFWFWCGSVILILIWPVVLYDSGAQKRK